MKTENMNLYNFMVIVKGGDIVNDDELSDALYQAGCDDSTPGMVDGIATLEFDREAADLYTALTSAIADIESIPDLTVVRIANAGLMTMAAIAERVGRGREAIRLLVTGENGPGGFPAPATNTTARYRMWYWNEVASWFKQAFSEDHDTDDDWIIQLVNNALEFRNGLEHVQLNKQEKRTLAQLAKL